MARKTTTETFVQLSRRMGWRLAIAGSMLASGNSFANEAELPPTAEPPTAEVVESLTSDYSEDSVLIATRQLDEVVEESASGLEPISQHSEQAPELADPRPEVIPAPSSIVPLAEAAADALKPVEKEPAPLATNPAPAKSTAAKPTATKPVSEATPRVAARFRRPNVANDPADVASAYAADTYIEPARFHGIIPGKSTLAELRSAWGEAEETSPTESGEMLLYEMPPFAAVDVMIEDEVVGFIKVELDNQQQPTQLARRLRLDKFKAVEILDETGGLVVGKAYPEKGMLLLLAKPSVTAPPDAPQFVTHMVIQPVEAEAFALRADQMDFSAFEQKLADLEKAIAIEPTNAYANWQLAELYRLTGNADKATVAAAKAVEADSESDAYRLCWAECLTEQGKYDEAVLEARKVLDSADAPSVVKAGALHLMGRLASIGESGIADKAIGFHTMAIEIADRVATSADRTERLRAKRLLVDAHLAVAEEISRRKYARKDEIVGQWIGRASGLAEEMIKAGDGNLELRLIVARDALAALANLKPSKDPSPWVKEAEETAGQLLADNRDPLFRARVQWELGQAYFHALRVQHSRKEVEAGISYGEQAIRHLKSGAAATGELRPSAEMLVGRLHFHIGALHAVHKQDHAEAITWYDRAEPLLNSGKPKSELAVPRTRGEALVSMAVSYWDQGQRERAIDLTVSGAELMEQAVAGGVLNEKSLSVPYGNLATMHRRLGDRDASADYARLARGARGAEELSTPSFTEAVTKANPAPKKQTTTPKTAQRTPSSAKPSSSSQAKPQAKPASKRTQRTASRKPSSPSRTRKPSLR